MSWGEKQISVDQEYIYWSAECLMEAVAVVENLRQIYGENEATMHNNLGLWATLGKELYGLLTPRES